MRQVPVGAQADTGREHLTDSAAADTIAPFRHELPAGRVLLHLEPVPPRQEARRGAEVPLAGVVDRRAVLGVLYLVPALYGDAVR